MRRVLSLATSLGLLGLVVGCHHCIHGVCDCDPSAQACGAGHGCAGCTASPGHPSYADNAGYAGGHLVPAAAAVAPVVPGTAPTIRPEPIREMPKPVEPDKGPDKTTTPKDDE
jgi:hypothetical protein